MNRWGKNVGPIISHSKPRTSNLAGRFRSVIGTCISFCSMLARKARASDYKSKKKWERFCAEAHICAKYLSGILILFLFSPAVTWASIDPQQAVMAIVGEAAGEPYLGKVAIAEAIRNRGNLNGVYGLARAAFISAQPKWAHEDARRAWDESARSNLVKGADHWESVDFKTPAWAPKMICTAQIGKHRFYRSGKAAQREC